MIRLLTFLFYLGVLFGQDKGKKAYEEGHYDKARVYYEHVLKNRKKDDGAQFGLGVTAYQQKDMETAARALNNAMNSDDKSLASKAMYNLGNMFRDQQKMEESLALYRKAIELDPTDEDAKVNYELLKQVLQQQEQQQQDKQNQEQDQEKQDQQKQDQDSEGQNEQNKNQDNQEKGEDQQQSQSEKEKEKKEQQQSQAKKDETQDQKTDKQMQAEAILNALKDQEKINQKRQIAKSKSRKLEKDW
jgi:Ca-activated chloride channel family protein